jgi:hypothetical protein
MSEKEAFAYAKKATGCRHPFAVVFNALLPLTLEQADRAQVISRRHPLGGIEFFAIDHLTRRTLAPGWMVARASAAERKRYHTELLTHAWGALAQELTPTGSVRA